MNLQELAAHNDPKLFDFFVPQVKTNQGNYSDIQNIRTVSAHRGEQRDDWHI